VNDLKSLVIGAEALFLLLLGAANILGGQFLGAVILIGVALLAAACAWALWPARGH
jgi:cadmium resistance protein CadD (predicted permease)